MSDSGRIIRLSRTLRGTRHKALIVAFDHALVLGPIPGTEDPVGQIRRFTAGGADAILLNLGLLQDCIASVAPGPLPGIIARIDWTTVWVLRETPMTVNCAVASWAGPQTPCAKERMPC